MTSDLTSKQDIDDSPSVIGCVPHPMPTREEFRAAHKAEYVRLFVEIGVPADTATAWHDDSWEQIKDGTPEEAVAAEVEYWENDGE